MVKELFEPLDWRKIDDGILLFLKVFFEIPILEYYKVIKR